MSCQILSTEQNILQENDSVENIYLIKSGCVKVYSRNYESHLTTYNEGSYFGEYQIMLDLNAGCLFKTEFPEHKFKSENERQ